MRVELQNVKKTYGNKTVLDVDSLTLEKGKVYALLGPNGSGKSTMLRIMAGFDSDFTGSVSYNESIKKQAKEIAYMPQMVYMFDISVYQNVILGLQEKKELSCDVKTRVERALGFVGMKEFSDVKARSLSGGEAQRVALARTLILGRSLVLLDEPASATDISGVQMAENYIRTVNKDDGSTIVFSTHNPSQAAHVADEVIMMFRGKVVERGTPSKVFNSPEEQETKDFLQHWRI